MLVAQISTSRRALPELEVLTGKFDMKPSEMRPSRKGYIKRKKHILEYWVRNF